MSTRRVGIAAAGALMAGVGQATTQAPVGLRFADALAGVAFLAAAVVAVDMPGTRRWSWFPFGAGAVWLLGSAVPGAHFAWRLAMSAAVLTFPTGRLVHPAAVIAVAASGVVAVPIAGVSPAAVLAASALVAAASIIPSSVVKPGTARHNVRTGAGLSLATAMVWPVAATWLWEERATVAALAAYGNCVLLATTGFLLWGGLMDARSRQRHVDAAVVELDAADPILHALTDPSGLGPSGLAARQSALALLNDNRELQEGLEHQMAMVASSQRRLLDSAAVERDRLAARLHSDVLPALDCVEDELVATHGLTTETQLRTMVDSARDELDGCRADLADLVNGLHPEALRSGGLVAALVGLARRAAFPVDLTVTTDRCPEASEVAAWFLCAEALANIGKHAHARHVRVEVQGQDGWLLVKVIDDGVGGAGIVAGGGLAGLQDRLRAFGGELWVESPTSGGTRLVGRLPCSR